MLGELVGVSVRTVRRWHRAQFIEPVSEVMQLPQFDYLGLLRAKQLAQWMQQGATVSSIQSQLERLQGRFAHDVGIDELPISADGKCLILRTGESYLEATGQLRFGFDDPTDSDVPITLKFESPEPKTHSFDDASDGSTVPSSLQEMIDEAIVAEDAGDLDLAVHWYRCALAAFGPNPDLCFQLAEVLYRIGDAQGARERYFMALELNPELIEARANLGCVLAECGQLDLAVAAFDGTLEQFEEYADVHFHLARTLDELNERGRAVHHWRRFVELAPTSPWADEARQRLTEHVPLLDLSSHDPT